MSDFSGGSILSNITVLYVEDEEFTRIELSKFLRRRVGRLITASDAEDGLDSISRYNPDIVITDLKMAGISGLEMIRESRDSGFEGGFIITSAVSDSETILEALDIGVAKYLVKPVDTVKLIEYLNEIAEMIITEKNDGLVLGHKCIIDRDQKKEMEEAIKGKVAYFMKKYTGKGPRNIRVFIQANTISVDAEEVLTVFEQNILTNTENYSLIEYVRKVFYKENKKDLEKVIFEAIETPVSMESADCDSKNNIDNIKFAID